MTRQGVSSDTQLTSSCSLLLSALVCRLTVWLTCRRDRRDAKAITARNFADFGRRTYAEGGQVQPVLGALRM
jgi:hypothetical protein